MPFGINATSRDKVRKQMKSGKSATNLGKAGTKYRGARNNTLMSILDGTNITNQYASRVEKYGGDMDSAGQITKQPGVVRFKALGDGGQGMGGATLNFGGRTFQADGQGNFTLLSSEYLSEEAKLAEQIDEYVNEVTRYCLANDETCASILTNGDAKALQLILGSKSGLGDNDAGFTIANATQGGSGLSDETAAAVVDAMAVMPKEIKEASGLPSLLASIDGSSNLFGLGLSKLKRVVREVAPILDRTQSTYKESKLDDPDV